MFSPFSQFFLPLRYFSGSRDFLFLVSLNTHYNIPNVMLCSSYNITKMGVASDQKMSTMLIYRLPDILITWHYNKACEVWLVNLMTCEFHHLSLIWLVTCEARDMYKLWLVRIVRLVRIDTCEACDLWILYELWLVRLMTCEVVKLARIIRFVGNVTCEACIFWLV